MQKLVNLDWNQMWVFAFNDYYKSFFFSKYFISDYYLSKLIFKKISRSLKKLHANLERFGVKNRYSN